MEDFGISTGLYGIDKDSEIMHTLFGHSPRCLNDRHFVQIEVWQVGHVTAGFIDFDCIAHDGAFEAVLSSDSMGFTDCEASRFMRRNSAPVFVDSVNNRGGMKVEHCGTGQYSLSGVDHSSNLALYSSTYNSSIG